MRTQSFSSISLFKTCPFAYKLRYIDDIPGQKNQVMHYGKLVHSLIEKGRTQNTGIPALEYANEILKQNTKAKGLFCFLEEKEVRFAFSNKFEILDFKSSKAIYRGIIDFARIFVDKKKLHGSLNQSIKRIEIIDWKTGKSKANPRQIKTYALYYHILTGLNEIHAKYVYLNQKKHTDYVISNSDFQEIKDWILTSVQEIQKKSTDLENFSPRINCWRCAYCEYKEMCQQEKDKTDKVLFSLSGLEKLGFTV